MKISSEDTLACAELPLPEQLSEGRLRREVEMVEVEKDNLRLLGRWAGAGLGRWGSSCPST